MKEYYMIRAKTINGYTQYLITLPREIAEKWMQVSKLVRYTYDPSQPWQITIKLVRPEEVK